MPCSDSMSKASAASRISSLLIADSILHRIFCESLRPRALCTLLIFFQTYISLLDFYFGPGGIFLLICNTQLLFLDWWPFLVFATFRNNSYFPNFLPYSPVWPMVD